MNKNTSIMMVAALAGIMVAGALALVVPVQVKADQFAGNGGIGGAGGAGGVAGNGGANANSQASGTSNHNHQSANGGDANGGNGGSANGGNICNHVKVSRAHAGEVCGSS